MKNIKTDILDKLDQELIAEMQKIWFVADLHNEHPKIVPICNRPVYLNYQLNENFKKKEIEDPEYKMYEDPQWKVEMNKIHDEWLVKEVFNKYVQKKDEVYLIGDVSFAKRVEAQKFVARLNGNKHLIIGNHDKNIKNLGNWSSVTHIKDFTFSRGNLNIHIVLCHFPIASWNRKIHGSWHLYGHVHSRFINTGLSWDVGIDNRETRGGVFHWCRPVNLYEVCLIMADLQSQGAYKDGTEVSIDLE